MKHFYLFSSIRLLSVRFVFTTVLTLSLSHLFAQIQPFNPGRFGIDGDVRAEERLSGSFEPLGSHDWFNGLNSSNQLGVFDTAGTATNKALIAAGRNYTFNKKMQYTPYSIQDGFLMLGGTYARDYFGIGAATDQTDNTVFVPSTLNNKSFESPSAWTTLPLGGTVPSKTDIIDTYIHLRRNGSSIASNLMIYFAASTLSTGGDHHLDFELYKSNIAYNSASGMFTSSGPLSTGGRNSWEFNSDGSVKNFGEMSLSFSFSSAAVSDIAIYIWVPYSTYASVNPKDFDFVASEWNGASKSGGYGYARIKPNNGTALQAWGTVNNATTMGPEWGTNSREIGTGISGYSSSYSQGQFAEGAIDLTSLGIDPAFATEGNKCRSPYVKVLVKSRSSSSFSSALQDFVAPYELFEEPALPITLPTPDVLSCRKITQVLSPNQVISGVFYKWSTNNGHIVSGANTASALIDKGGSYTLSVALYEGCTETSTQVVVPADTSRPFASADYTGWLTGSGDSSITLRGGDSARSNYATPFGGSHGLNWQWDGPNGFSSMLQNPRAKDEGSYRLTITEIRNGCTASAQVNVAKVEQIILPLTLLNYFGKIRDDKAELSWQVDGNEDLERFEVERIIGKKKSTAAIILATELHGIENYSFQQIESASGVAYRLKMLDKQNHVHYSSWLYLNQKPVEQSRTINIVNPTRNNVDIKYTAPESDLIIIHLYNASGMLVYRCQQQCSKGVNQFSIPANALPVKGQYAVSLVGSKGQKTTAKVIKL